jgi:hypothetical protein
MAKSRRPSIPEEPSDRDRRPATRVAVRTVYLTDPVGDVHTLTLVGTLGATGTLWLDRNACRVDDFGDAVPLTQAPSQDLEVLLVRRQAADPLGRQLYAVENNGLAHPLDLVVPADGIEPFRFVYHDRGALTPRPITLERLLHTGGGGPRGDFGIELCVARYSVQQQPDGIVSVCAFGSHPTSGFRVFFSQLPYPVFPPEFELLHVTPSDITTPVVTPFVKQTSFDAHTTVDYVILHDADGTHTVLVEQVPGPHRFAPDKQ